MLKILASSRFALRTACQATSHARNMAVLASAESVKKLQAQALATPHSDALKMACDGAKPVLLSYRQLAKEVDAFANGLYEIPFKRPASMVMWTKDCAEAYVAQLGAIKAGINVLYLDETAKEQDLVKALNGGARWLLVSPTVLPQLEAFKVVNKLIPELTAQDAEVHDRIIRVRSATGRTICCNWFPVLDELSTFGQGMVKFAHMLSYVRQSAVNAEKPALGGVCFYGTAKINETPIPYFDPAVKLSDLSASTSPDAH